MKPSSKNLRSWLLAFSAGVVLSSTLTVQAVEYTWDSSATAGIQTGGTNWATTATTWTADGGTTRIGWPNTGTDSALFAGPIAADITVSLNSNDIQLDDFTSNLTSNFLYLAQVSSTSLVRTLTLTGGTYDGTGTTGSQFNIAGGSVSFAGTVGTTRFLITGNSDIVKLGAGSLFFSAGSINNTFVGNIHIKQGSVLVNNTADDTSLGDPANDIHLDGGALSSNGTTDTTLTIGSGRTITLGAGNGSIGSNNINFALQGQITGGGSLTKTGPKTLTLNAASDYSGTTTISAGSLRLGASGTIPSGSAVTINGSGSFNVRNTNNWVYNGTITGDGTGSITPNTGTNATLAGPISGVASITANNAGTATTVSGAITGATTTVTVAGGAILTLSGNNSAMGGNVTFSGGTASKLNIGHASALGTGTLVIGGTNHTIDNSSGAALTLATNNAQTWNSDLVFTGTHSLDMGNGAVTLGGNRTIFAQNNTLTVGGVISGDFGITKSSTGGTLALTGNSTYTGNTLIAAGSLSINSIANYGVNSAIGAPLSGHLQLGGANNFCALIYTGASASTNRTVQLGSATATNTGVGVIQNNGSGALTFTATNFNPTISGITVARTLFLGGTYTGGPNEIQGIIQDNDVTGPVSVGKATDASTWVLSGANTHTGATFVNGGTLKLGSTGSIDSSTAVSISAGATLDTSAKPTHIIPATQSLTFGINAAGSGSSGKIVAADLNVSAAVVTFNITGTPNDPAYVLATYDNLVGAPSFAAPMPTPPAGYSLDFAYEGNKIALVQVAGYDTWKTQITNGLNLRTDDADGDGFNNLQEFLFGTSPIASNGSLVTTTTSGGDLILRWLQRETGATYTLKQSATLAADSWSPSAPQGAIDGDQGGAPTDYDYHTASLPTSGGKLFFRIEGVEN